jgi:hypothetical protein
MSKSPFCSICSTHAALNQILVSILRKPLCQIDWQCFEAIYGPAKGLHPLTHLHFFCCSFPMWRRTDHYGHNGPHSKPRLLPGIARLKGVLLLIASKSKACNAGFPVDPLLWSLLHHCCGALTRVVYRPTERDIRKNLGSLGADEWRIATLRPEVQAMTRKHSTTSACTQKSGSLLAGSYVTPKWTHLRSPTQPSRAHPSRSSAHCVVVSSGS